MFNYPNVCQNLVKDLPPRIKEVVVCRFGLETEKKETLDAIGKKYGITRERVRQIQEDGLNRTSAKIKANSDKSLYQNIFKSFIDYFKKEGKIKREDKLLEQLGENKYANHIYFLLVLGEDFKRIKGEQEFHPFWVIEDEIVDLAKQVAKAFVCKFDQEKKPLELEEAHKVYEEEMLPQTKKLLNPQTLLSFLEISKKIAQSPNNRLGLGTWPEINPKGVRDKVYLMFKEQGRPLYFKEVTLLINECKGIKGTVLSQTVHNELIRDDRFVLIGRGIYALKEWGYKPGVVKDVILEILKEKSLTKEEIVAKVSEQRQVKKNTIILNLQNKNYFQKDDQERYSLKI